MAQRIEITSQSPYFDDFDTTKDYFRVLFRPGFPVQARELTTLQTFLQEQTSRFGDKVLSGGTAITGGEIAIQNNTNRFVLTGSGNASFTAEGVSSTSTLGTIGQFEGLVVSNAGGTVKAKVVRQPSSTNNTSQVGNMYFEYITESTFDSTGGYIFATVENNPSLTTSLWNSYSGLAESCLAQISEGVIYVKGIFVRLAKQVVLVDSTSKTPSGILGFTANEKIVTQNDDSSLFDNSRNSSNEGAPGAHRLKLDINFAFKSLTAAADETFYAFATIKNGVRDEENFVNQTYNDLIDIMARRTYDESGNYTLKPFTHSFAAADSDNKFNLVINPSKSYVQGYEIEKRTQNQLPISRSINDVERYKNYKVPVVGTTSVVITNISNTLPGQSGGNPYASAQRLILRNVANQQVGVARGYAVIDSFEKGVAKQNCTCTTSECSKCLKLLQQHRMFKEIWSPRSEQRDMCTQTKHRVYSQTLSWLLVRMENSEQVKLSQTTFNQSPKQSLVWSAILWMM